MKSKEGIFLEYAAFMREVFPDTIYMSPIECARLVCIVIDAAVCVCVVLQCSTDNNCSHVSFLVKSATTARFFSLFLCGSTVGRGQCLTSYQPPNIS